jgi:ubiquitin-conjugating enzyme E2 Z
MTALSPLSLALAVACRDIDVRNVKALIIGPHETPYEFGFFEVAMPCPHMQLCSTNLAIVCFQVQ